MNRTKEVQNSSGELIGYIIRCPACEAADVGSAHLFYLKMQDKSPGWSFNGDFENPTFSPSMLARGQVRCHSFVKEGKIQYLNDCTHDMKGQTVDLPDVEGWLE